MGSPEPPVDHPEPVGSRQPDWAAKLPVPIPSRLADSVLARIPERFIAIAGIDMAFRLAAQAFISLIPLMVVAAFASPIGGSKAFQTTLINLFGLHGAPRTMLQGLAGTGRQVSDSLTIVGILVIVYSAMSFTRTFRRVYERAWDLPKLGLKGTVGDVLWLVSLIVYLAVLSSIRGRLGGSLVSGVFALVLSFGFWVWTPALLLGRRVPFLRLLPTGAVMVAGMILLAGFAQVYMPHLIVSKYRQFGQIGIVFAILSWFIACCFVLVAGACTGAVLGEWLGSRSSQQPSPELVDSE